MSHEVAPHVGAWIETLLSPEPYSFLMSHPMWVRGLKLKAVPASDPFTLVAPHVGAWIETFRLIHPLNTAFVAPHVGAWIETRFLKRTSRSCWSHPMWVRGLKQA